MPIQVGCVDQLILARAGQVRHPRTAVERRVASLAKRRRAPTGRVAFLPGNGLPPLQKHGLVVGMSEDQQQGSSSSKQHNRNGNGQDSGFGGSGFGIRDWGSRGFWPPNALSYARLLAGRPRREDVSMLHRRMAAVFALLIALTLAAPAVSHARKDHAPPVHDGWQTVHRRR